MRVEGGARRRLSERVLLRAWPSSFRAEYAAELEACYAQLRSATPGWRFWPMVFADVVRSAPREWLHEWRAARADRRAQDTNRPDYGAAFAAALAVFVLYRITLAPSIAFWDTGEYVTAAHVLGIPHPPGNALFVFLARAWDVLLSPTSWDVAVRVNVLSAACSSVAHFYLFLIVERSLRGAWESSVQRRVAASCAVLLSATAFTVWSQSNVNEKVYTLSFATTLATMWLAVRWRDTRSMRLLMLAVYVTALTSVNHLMGVLVVPALVTFVFVTDARTLLRSRLWLSALPLVALGLSAHLFLPLRAAQRPVVNEPDPSCASLGSAVVSIYTNGAAGCDALSATLRREQYGKPSILSDPARPDEPRSASLLASQLLNYAQYLDWQWARSVAGRAPLFGGARPVITLCILALLLLGARAQWRADRATALGHAVLLLTLSLGLVFYLNFKYGFVIAREIAPDDALHEVRERDYFFLISFSLAGAWAGLGLAALWRRSCAAVATQVRMPRLAASPVLALALLPMLLNWPWASRSDDWTARDYAYNTLMSVEPYGILVTNGDNDSFPLWYLQHVERVREDVSIVLAPYLAFPWYVRQVRDASRPCTPTIAAHDRTRVTCQQPLRVDAIHPRLLAAWANTPAAPPEDSILPLSDADIDAIARGWYVTPEQMTLSAGPIEGSIPEGTMLTPVDTFVAAMIRSNVGRRPIHFMSPSPVVGTLGLGAHTVRVGLTWRLRDGRDVEGRELRLPPETSGSTGAWIDIVATDTLARDVFIRRGRILRADLPWVDHATYSMPMQYSVMHYAAALAHELRGSEAGVRAHVSDLEFWQRFTAQ